MFSKTKTIRFRSETHALVERSRFDGESFTACVHRLLEDSARVSAVYARYGEAEEVVGFCRGEDVESELRAYRKAVHRTVRPGMLTFHAASLERILWLQVSVGPFDVQRKDIGFLSPEAFIRFIVATGREAPSLRFDGENWVNPKGGVILSPIRPTERWAVPAPDGEVLEEFVPEDDPLEVLQDGPWRCVIESPDPSEASPVGEIFETRRDFVRWAARCWHTHLSIEPDGTATPGFGLEGQVLVLVGGEE